MNEVEEAAARLNRLCDRASAVVKDCEARWDAAGVGEEAWVTVSPGWSLGYARHAGKFRIMGIVPCPGEDDYTRTIPFCELSRSEKLEVVRAIPALCAEILARLKERADEAEAALKGLSLPS